MKNGKYMDILAGYIRSILQDIESSPRTEVDLVKNYIKMVLDEFNSSFTTYKIHAGFYAFRDLSEAPLKILQSEKHGDHDAIRIEFVDVSMK